MSDVPTPTESNHPTIPDISNTTWNQNGRLCFSMSGPATGEQIALVHRVGEGIGLHFDALCNWWRDEHDRPQDWPILQSVLCAYEMGKATAHAATRAQDDADASDPNAPWLSLAHAICTDLGIPHGRVMDRLQALREHLSDKPIARQTDSLDHLSDTEIEALAKFGPVAYLRTVMHPDNIELCGKDAPGAFPVYADPEASEYERINSISLRVWESLRLRAQQHPVVLEIMADCADAIDTETSSMWDEDYPYNGEQWQQAAKDLRDRAAAIRAEDPEIWEALSPAKAQPAEPPTGVGNIVTAPVAYVPIHPRNGPLWGETFQATRDVAESRPKSYPLMALYSAAHPNTRLANAVRARADELRDSELLNEASTALLEHVGDVVELARVLARILEGNDLASAFGRPGDWGYQNPIGAALAAMRSPVASTSQVQPAVDQADYRSMFLEAARTLASIDEALGIHDDGCADPERTLDAIRDLKALRASAEDDELRIRVGQAISHAMGNPGEDGSVHIDPCDSDEIDPLVDAVFDALSGGSRSAQAGIASPYKDAPAAPLSPDALLDDWIDAAGLQFVSRSSGQYTTNTVSRDDLLQLVHAAAEFVGKP